MGLCCGGAKNKDKIELEKMKGQVKDPKKAGTDTSKDTAAPGA